jgi:CRISPR-associated protein Cas1
MRRPPLDPINALLSFLYTLLTHDCRSAAENVGLDPAVGFLHRDRPGRPSLALDLMEELRPALADRLALSLINRRQLRPTDFEERESGAVFLNDQGRKTVLTAWQERKRQEHRHDFLEENAPLDLVPYLQAQLLARHLRGDGPSPPMRRRGSKPVMRDNDTLEAMLPPMRRRGSDRQGDKLGDTQNGVPKC